MTRRRFYLPILVVLVLVTVLAAPLVSGTRAVAAQDSVPGFAIKAEPGPDPATTEHGYFVYELASGKRVTGSLRLSNPTDEAIIVDLSTVDAITANTGGSAFETGDVETARIGTWVTLDQTEITVKPGDDQLVEFTVRVPKNTAPGQYLAGLAAAAQPQITQEATPVTVDAKQAGATIDLRTRYVIGVEIDVPGDWTPSLQIDDVQLIDYPSGTIIGITMANDGATFLKPTGSLTVTGADGATALEQPIEMGTFVTGTSVVYPINWPPTLLPGTYGIHVELTYGTDLTAIYDGTLEAGTETAPTIAITDVTIEEVRDPSSDALQLVTVGVAVENPGQAIPNARLTLHVERDGETVEDFVLGDALIVPQGPTQVNQRYLPLTGWTAGTYTFSVSLDAIDATSGKATRLSDATATTTVVVK